MNSQTPAKNDLVNIIIITVVVLLTLVPFSAKAFHVDDPMFLWTAEHIQSNPINFYGFDVNWYSAMEPMHTIMKNPPLVSYYIALVASAFGWGERVMHISFALPAVMVALGTYYLAKRFTSMPLLAALFAMLTPAFMVSETTVMSDMTMLAFWCWAVVLWVHGLDKEDHLYTFAAGVLVAASALTKYFGVSLMPLLVVYTVLRGKKNIKWLLWMTVPAVILGGYQWLTHELYGQGFFLDVADYAISHRYVARVNYLENGLVGLIFAGGCVITALFYYPVLWPRGTVVTGVIFAFAASVIMLIHRKGMGIIGMGGGRIEWGLIVQASLFALGGISILSLAIEDAVKNNDGASALFVLWVIGAFIFASFVNWTTNARAVFPMAPAAGILFVRKLERLGMSSRRTSIGQYVPLIPAAIIALSVTWADYGLANSSRQAAHDILGKYSNKTARVWFQGHWGFQYYMEEGGARAIDWSRSHISKGDIMVIPAGSANIMDVPEEQFSTVEVLRYRPSSYISTLSGINEAGFYSTRFGVLPYRFGREFEDIYVIKRAKLDLRYNY